MRRNSKTATLKAVVLCVKVVLWQRYCADSACQGRLLRRATPFNEIEDIVQHSLRATRAYRQTSQRKPFS